MSFVFIVSRQGEDPLKLARLNAMIANVYPQVPRREIKFDLSKVQSSEQALGSLKEKTVFVLDPLPSPANPRELGKLLSGLAQCTQIFYVFMQDSAGNTTAALVEKKNQLSKLVTSERYSITTVTEDQTCFTTNQVMQLQSRRIGPNVSVPHKKMAPIQKKAYSLLFVAAMAILAVVYQLIFNRPLKTYTVIS